MNLRRYLKFLPDAFQVATHSKYANTRVGCVILGSGLEVRSSGWNGAPRGSAADEDDRLDDRDTKLAWAVHAEANAIANAARCGVSLAGCVAVVTHMPCMTCSKLLVQAGIVAIVCPAPSGPFYEKWREDIENSVALLAEVGVQLHYFRG